MLEQVTKTASYFVPLAEEQSELYTNKDVERFATDEMSRYELIGGELIVSTAPRFMHQLIATRIVAQFLKYLEINPLGHILTTPGLILSDFDGVIPDLIFISFERCDEILNEKTGKFDGSPEIVIEILSPGRVNARRDLELKRELYQFYKVPEYWVINPQESEVEVFRFGKDAEKFSENEMLETEVLPDFKLNIKKLFES